jgi:hypothetical protein
MMSDVGGKIIEQFAACLSDKLAAPAAAPVTEAEPETVGQLETEPLDLVQYARGSALKRVGPVVAAAMLVLIIGALLRHLRSRD